MSLIGGFIHNNSSIHKATLKGLYQKRDMFDCKCPISLFFLFICIFFSFAGCFNPWRNLVHHNVYPNKIKLFYDRFSAFLFTQKFNFLHYGAFY